MDSRPKAGTVACSRNPWWWADLQQEILETAYLLWRYDGMCICVDMEQHDVSRLLAGLSRHHGQRPCHTELQQVSALGGADYISKRGKIQKTVQEPKGQISPLARHEYVLPHRCICTVGYRRIRGCRTLGV